MIRNPDGWWINTSYFTERADHFLKYGYYTDLPNGTAEYYDFWREELDRCINGFEVGGARVTGHHYFYLNYCPIKKQTKAKGNVASKKYEFPDFWDYDYEFFHTLDIARYGTTEAQLEALHLTSQPLFIEGGRHVIVAKARRKGYSYKNGAVCVNTYNTVRGSTSLIGAADSSYLFPDGTMSMVHKYLSHLNEHTGWSKQRLIDRQLEVKSGFETIEDGVKKQKGYQSSIIGLTFRDNPDAARGKDGSLMVWEECGAFSNLIDSYNATKPAFTDGKYTTGLMCLFGCVCAGTKVWDGAGKLVNIEDLKQDDGIVGFDGSQAIPQEINWMKPPSKKPCYRIETSSGNSIECSFDHPLLASKNRMVKRVNGKSTKVVMYTHAERIQVGDQLMMPDSIPVFGDKRVDNAYLYGLLIGDGYYASSVEIGQPDDELKEIIESYPHREIKNKSFETQDGRTYKAYTLHGLKPELEANGMFGQTKDDKRFPIDLHEYDKESLAEIIAGYFDADGDCWYNKNKNAIRVRFSSVVPELLEELRYALLKLGIHSNVTKEARNTPASEGYEGRKPFIFRLNIQSQIDVKRFKETIPFKSVNKFKSIDNIKQVASRRTVDRAVIVTNPDNGKEHFLNGDMVSGMRYQTVTSVEYIGEHDIYNLNCSPNHTYISNGFIHAQTGGDMSRGSVDFSEMFYNPETYGLLPFNNQWDDGADGTKCGFFVPAYVTMGGFIDEQGNSLNDEAKEYEDNERRKKASQQNGSTALSSHVTEFPFKPSEAFLVTNLNDFPIEELNRQLTKIRTTPHLAKLGQCVRLARIEGEVKAIPDWSGTLTPLKEYPIKGNDLTGAVVIYEHPIKNAPKGLYKLGYDPYVQDQSQGPSLGAIFVYKSTMIGVLTRDMIVAEYVGRPSTPDDCHRIAELLAEYYDGQIMIENMVKDAVSYFTRRNKINLLASQPDTVIGNVVKNSKVQRKYGVHMNAQIKDAMQKYIKNWLLMEREEEDGRITTNIDYIFSEGLLEELMKYNPKKGNFDRVFAFGMVLIQLQEESDGKIYGNKNEKATLSEFAALIREKYSK